MSPDIPENPFDGFQVELAAAEVALSASSMEWSVREADLERRLRALNARSSELRRILVSPAARRLGRRDAVSLYSSRWCHVARHSLVMAK